MASQSSHDATYSLEFFPPKSKQGRENLRATLAQLAPLRPDYVSVTFGAGGTTRSGTLETALMVRDAGIPPAPHLSCIGATREEIAEILDTYRAEGIRRIVALRGDIPSGMGAQTGGDFHHANELVAFIRSHAGDHFTIEVAAYPEFHPQAPSARDDLRYFAQKVRAGADGALTQYFYNADAYFRFVEDARRLGVTVPIVPGIMPITNYAQLARFSDACGAEIPRWLRWRLADFGDDLEGLRAFGLDVVRELCQKLLEGGAPGLHFYTMNRAEPTATLWKDLGLPHPPREE